MRRAASVLLRLALALTAACAALAANAEIYRYKDKDGHWVYTDQPPVGVQTPVAVSIGAGAAPPRMVVEPRNSGGEIAFVAINECRCPVEFGLRVGADDATAETGHAVVAAQSEQVLLTVPAPPGIGNIPFDFGYVIGEPGVRHSPAQPYRLPFAVAQSFKITQAPPQHFTHRDWSSFNAVDFEMPVGTPIHAAREGLVINVAHRFFKSGLSTQMLGEANFVQVLHDDGTTAVYAHLQMDTVRVRPGQRVRRGEYIANSGNTGFSGGPHLHFAVLRNAGMRSESVPVTFAGVAGASVTPQTGLALEAY
jgi:murein DD-endopeptidase MepM/ murein hydrolase activator NlpD